MPFPSKIYTCALILEEGHIDFLHYGLFKETNNRLHKAQRYSTEFILAKLPKPPSQILNICSKSSGAIQKTLFELGYQVHNINTDNPYSQNNTQEKNSLISCNNLENLVDKPESYDLILLHESAQTIDPLIIFNQALDLLKPNGCLLIVGEFSLKHTEPTRESLHLLNDIFTLAERFNFTLTEYSNLSQQALPTLEYLLTITNKHQQQIIHDLSLTKDQFDLLNQSYIKHQEKYFTDHYGYALLHFQKTTYPKWRIQSLNKKHLDKMLRLFELSFHQTMSPELWHWKYASEIAHELCVWEGEELIAHYGGIPRKILFFGRPQMAIQIGDVMVNPAHRGILTRQGAFFSMAATFLERYIGFGKAFLLGFGFPNERAMKVAEHLNLYAEVGNMLELSWTSLSSRPKVFSHLSTVNNTNIQDYKNEIDTVWHHMSEDFQNTIIGIRDWNYLHQRYLNHPEHIYQLFLVKSRIAKQPLGIIVLREIDQRIEIMDIISSSRKIPLLILHARRFANILGYQNIHCQITQSYAHYFTTSDCQSKQIDVRIPTNIWTSAPPPNDIENYWWLTNGDMDYK